MSLVDDHIRVQIESPRTFPSILGWVISWAYCVTFVPVFATTATQYSDDAWVVSLIGAIAIGCLSTLLIYAGHGRPVWTRWLALPHLFTAFFGLGVIYPALLGSTFGGHHLAAIALGSPQQTDIATPLWHRLYALVHLAFFGMVLFLAFRPLPRLSALTPRPKS